MMQSYKRHEDLPSFNEQLFEPKVKNVNKAWMLGEEFVKFYDIQ